MWVQHPAVILLKTQAAVAPCSAACDIKSGLSATLNSDSDCCRRIHRNPDNSSWNLRPEPHGQRSFRPSFSVSSLLPWTDLWPRRTLVSEGYPLPPFARGLESRRGCQIRRCISWDTSYIRVQSRAGTLLPLICNPQGIYSSSWRHVICCIL